MTFKIGCCTVPYDVAKYPLEKTFESISGLGFTGVETGYRPEVLANGRKSLSKLLKKYDLEPANLDFFAGTLSEPDARKAREILSKYKKGILLARDDGFVAMVTTTGPAPEGLTEERSLQLSADLLAQVADYAKDHEVRLLIETYGASLARNSDIFLKLHTLSASNNLFANVDPGNYWVVGDDAISAVKKLGSLVGGVHTKDVVKIGGKPYFASPGKGLIDWIAFLKALKSVGYDKKARWLNIEYEGGMSGKFDKDPEKGSRESRDYITTVVKDLAKH